MERRIGKITLYQHLDADKMAEFIAAGDTVLLEIERQYPLGDVPATLTAVLPAQWADPDVDFYEALTRVTGAAAYTHEQGCYVFKINYGGGDFDLTQSYEPENLVNDGTPVPDGTVLMAEFTTAGLPESIKTRITLPYSEAVSSADDDALKDVGLSLVTGATGSAFSIGGVVPYTVRFYRPDDAVKNYVIDFNAQNVIIAP